MGLERTDRIRVWIVTRAAEVNAAIEENRDYLMRETLAVELDLEKPVESIESIVVEVAGQPVEIFVIKAR
jgi:hypothetical protein